MRNHAMLHPIPRPHEPFWHGIIFVLLGALIAVFSRKLVAMQLKSRQSVTRKMLGPIDYDQSPLLRNVNSSWYQRYLLISYWFGTLLLAVVPAGLGVVIMLGLVYTSG